MKDLIDELETFGENEAMHSLRHLEANSAVCIQRTVECELPQLLLYAESLFPEVSDDLQIIDSNDGYVQ